MNSDFIIVLEIVGVGALITTYVILFAISANHAAEEKRRDGKGFSFAEFDRGLLMAPFKTRAGRITLAVSVLLLVILLYVVA